MDDTISMENLDGKGVLTKDGRRLGQVSGIRVDPKSWHVDSLTVRLDRDLVTEFGMGRKLFGSHDVGILTEHVSAVSDTVLLRTTLKELEASHEAIVGQGAEATVAAD